jgi:hypothetical protein
MNETISSPAGGSHGLEMAPRTMANIAAEAGRPSQQRTTFYSEAPLERHDAAVTAQGITEVNLPAARRTTRMRSLTERGATARAPATSSPV